MQTFRLITTEKKIRLLEGFLYEPEGKIRLRQLAGRLGVNAGYASTFMKKMENAGLISKGRLNIGDPRIRALRMVFNIDKLASCWPELKKHGILGVGVFGSWAHGANTRASDLDVWVKTAKEPGVEEASRLREIFRKRAAVSEISLIVITPKSMAEMKAKDAIFYSSLLNSFHLGGEWLD